MILFAVILFAFFFNSALARLLPFAEGTILAIHVLGWFVVLISLVVVGPHHTNEEVWGTFLNLGGYEQSGVSFFVGLIGPVFAFMGADGATHMRFVVLLLCDRHVAHIPASIQSEEIPIS